jgi:hypothetical protein
MDRPQPALLGLADDSAIELLSAAVVLRHFYLTSSGTHAEEQTTKIEGGLLFLVIVAAGAMPWLAKQKRRLSATTGSAALRADAGESAVTLLLHAETARELTC